MQRSQEQEPDAGQNAHAPSVAVAPGSIQSPEPYGTSSTMTGSPMGLTPGLPEPRSLMRGGDVSRGTTNTDLRHTPVAFYI